MASYLIEFRFQSRKVKTHLQKIIYNIYRKFKIGKGKKVSHISLVCISQTTNERRLIYDFAKICSETKQMKFVVNGFGTFDNNRVVYANIDASTRLNDFRIKLVENIKSYCQVQPNDKNKDKDKFGYHSTLAMKMSPEKFNQVKKYVMRLPKPRYSHIVMRVTLLKRGKILREYDFMQRRLLNRKQALNRHITIKSKSLLKQFMRDNYNPDKKIKERAEPKIKSFWDKIKSFWVR
jgi:hypothetical protein